MSSKPEKAAAAREALSRASVVRETLTESIDLHSVVMDALISHDTDSEMVSIVRVLGKQLERLSDAKELAEQNENFLSQHSKEVAA